MTTTKAIYTRVIRKAPSRKRGAPAVLNRASRHHRALPRGIPAASALQKLNKRDGLVLKHLGLVKAIAINVHKKLPVHVDLDDLVQAGLVGLLDAANKFDANRQDVFSAYAKHRIRGAILDSLRQLDWASRDTRRKHKQVEAAKHDLTAVLLRVPTASELAEKLDMNMDRWHAMMLDLENIGPISADSSPKQCDDLPPLDLPSKRETQPDYICAGKELHSTLGEAIKTLPERYQRVVQLYYTEDLTMKEIGGRLDINESRISQIHKRALELMATVLNHVGIHSIHAFQV